MKREGGQFLKTTLVKSGVFGDLDKISWFFEGKQLAYDDQKKIPLTEFGTYKVLWSNCLTSVADSINYTSNEEEELDTPEIVQDANDEIISNPAVVQDAIAEDSTDIAVLIANKDTFVLKNLIFDLDKSIIKPEAAEELDKLAQIMKDKPAMKILLEGHTALGNAKKNQTLSEKRVKSTKKYLVEQGVISSHIQTKGWGQQKPLIYTRNNEKGRINRRVEIRILTR